MTTDPAPSYVPPRAIHRCEVTEYDTSSGTAMVPVPCPRPARLRRLPWGVERWVCDEHTTDLDVTLEDVR